jgi:hypothetical protein
LSDNQPWADKVVKRSQNRRNNLDAIRMLVLDIDGVLADGTIMVDA